MCSNASTTAGSNWTARSRRISASASALGQAALYGREWLSASKTSASATIRAVSGIVVAGEAVRIAGAVPPLVVEGRDLLGRLEDVRPAPGEDRAPDLGMRLDDVELLATQRAGLEQDRIGDADLADVVQECRLTDQLHRLPVEAELEGDAGSHVRDPVRVGLRVVVAILGGERESRQRLVVGIRELPRRPFQLERALVHRLLEPLLVLHARAPRAPSAR